MKKEKIRAGLIGFGSRGQNLLECVLVPMTEMDLVIEAVCDEYEDRAVNAADYVKEKTGRRPFCTTDYHEITAMEGLDAVIIMSAWESHGPIALEAMRAGKYVATEVGGAYSVDDCWALVKTSEATGMPCMLLENCCYGRREMMVLNMARLGVLGDIVHCSGGYCHDLREEIAYGKENRHYRLRNYLRRNCENYPTHELGPIAQVLNINNGNRLVSLSSAASCARGMHDYILDKKGPEDELASAVFAQGDIVTTTIRCAGGQTIVLTLDTTLPRYYSRGFTVRGSKGFYMEDTDSVFIEGIHNQYHLGWKSQWGNAVEFEEKYDHPLWKAYKDQVRGGHDGMDWLVFRGFLESVKNGTQPPIDVYDTATLMCISALSEESIQHGGTAVAIPDFTGGRWLERHDTVKGKYCLRETCEDDSVSIY